MQECCAVVVWFGDRRWMHPLAFHVRDCTLCFCGSLDDPVSADPVGDLLGDADRCGVVSLRWWEALSSQLLKDLEIKK